MRKPSIRQTLVNELPLLFIQWLISEKILTIYLDRCVTYLKNLERPEERIISRINSAKSATTSRKYSVAYLFNIFECYTFVEGSIWKVYSAEFYEYLIKTGQLL